MSDKPIVSVMKHITGLKSAVATINDAAIGTHLTKKFVEMYGVEPEEARRFYEREKDNFGKLISQSPALQKCTPWSTYMAFGKVMALKLTFDNGRAPLIYLIPGTQNKGTDKECQIMVAQPSPEGEKEVRINAGILKKVGQPIIVHKGDKYRKYLDQDTGQIVVQFEEAEKPSTEIIGSFIRLVEPDGTVVFKTFSTTDIEIWKAASTKKNYGKTNPLYSSGINGQIHEGLLKGKTLLHSFKGYKQVDYAYKAPEGFTPDKEAARQLNPDLLTDYEEVLAEEETPVVVKETDPFDEAIKQEDTPVQGVTVQTDDDDDPFNAK